MLSFIPAPNAMTLIRITVDVDLGPQDLFGKIMMFQTEGGLEVSKVQNSGRTNRFGLVEFFTPSSGNESVGFNSMTRFIKDLLTCRSRKMANLNYLVHFWTW